MFVQCDRKSSTSDGESSIALQSHDRQTDVDSIAPIIGQRDPEFEVTLDKSDPSNPQNWSTIYRAWVIGTVAFSAWIVVLYSTSYMSSVPGLKSEFGASSLDATMGLTAYLVGLAIGSLFSAPLSELYGRRIVYLVCFSIWTVLVIPCGLAQSFSTILASRFCG